MNKHAVMLGRCGKGKPKTMSPIAIKQRIEAAKASQLARRLRISSDKVKQSQNSA